MHKKTLLSYLIFLQRYYLQICHRSKFPSIVCWESSHCLLAVYFGLHSAHLLSFPRTIGQSKCTTSVFVSSLPASIAFFHTEDLWEFSPITMDLGILIEPLTSIHPTGALRETFQMSPFFLWGLCFPYFLVGLCFLVVQGGPVINGFRCPLSLLYDLVYLVRKILWG